MLGRVRSWLWRRIIPKRNWLDASSEYEPVKDHFAYKTIEEHDRGADLRFYRIREYEHKDTGESVFWKKGRWGREFYEWSEIRNDTKGEFVQYSHEMLMLARTARPLDWYDLGR